MGLGRGISLQVRPKILCSLRNLWNNWNGKESDISVLSKIEKGFGYMTKRFCFPPKWLQILSYISGPEYVHTTKKILFYCILALLFIWCSDMDILKA